MVLPLLGDSILQTPLSYLLNEERTECWLRQSMQEFSDLFTVLPLTYSSLALVSPIYNTRPPSLPRVRFCLPQKSHRDNSPERVSDTPAFTQPASGTTGSWFPAVGEGEPHLEGKQLQIVCGRDISPQKPRPDLPEPMEDGG